MNMAMDLLMSAYQGSLLVYALKKQFNQHPHSFLYEVGCVSSIVLYIFIIQFFKLPLPDSLLFIFPLLYIKLTSQERFITCLLWILLDGFLTM